MNNEKNFCYKLFSITWFDINSWQISYCCCAVFIADEKMGNKNNYSFFPLYFPLFLLLFPKSIFIYLGYSVWTPNHNLKFIFFFFFTMHFLMVGYFCVWLKVHFGFSVFYRIRILSGACLFVFSLMWFSQHCFKNAIKNAK